MPKPTCYTAGCLFGSSFPHQTLIRFWNIGRVLLLFGLVSCVLYISFLKCIYQMTENGEHRRAFLPLAFLACALYDLVDFALVRLFDCVSECRFTYIGCTQHIGTMWLPAVGNFLALKRFTHIRDNIANANVNVKRICLQAQVKFRVAKCWLHCLVWTKCDVSLRRI